MYFFWKDINVVLFSLKINAVFLAFIWVFYISVSFIVWGIIDKKEMLDTKVDLKKKKDF